MVALILAIGIALWISEPVFAEADGPDYFAVDGVGPDDVLNVRSEPSPTAEKIGEIPSGTGGLINRGCEGGLSFAEWETASIAERAKAAESRWCRIEYNGMTGWVAGWYLKESTGPDRRLIARQQRVQSRKPFVPTRGLRNWIVRARACSSWRCPTLT